MTDLVTTEDTPMFSPTPMTPREIVSELDRYIIGQKDAKRAVAIALRNRWRRMQLEEDLRKEVTPKNILMIGPTGVGKTEIARRLSQLADAPFIKVEATKFTEVGYVGRDVESIIRDLLDVSIKRAREHAIAKKRAMAESVAEDRILDALIPTPAGSTPEGDSASEEGETDRKDTATRKLFRKKLQDGELDDREIDIDIAQNAANVEIMGPPGMEEMVGQLQSMMESVSNKRKKNRRLTVKEAKKLLIEEEAENLIDEEEIRQIAIESAEQNGIVFIDEFDKITKSSEARGGDVSREGVQRDLLPLVEGCSVSTKHGMVKTDHMLFIASGAFHFSKPSDLVPELQGRFPIRVELKELTTEDFKRILTEPKASLTEQYAALLKTEDVHIEFTEEGVMTLAEVAYHVNDTTENIGARRLHTVMERLLDDISFEATDRAGEKITIDGAYVKERLKALSEDEDLSRWIL